MDLHYSEKLEEMELQTFKLLTEEYGYNHLEITRSPQINCNVSELLLQKQGEYVSGLLFMQLRQSLPSKIYSEFKWRVEKVNNDIDLKSMQQLCTRINAQQTEYDVIITEELEDQYDTSYADRFCN